VQQYYDAAEVQDNSLVVVAADRYQCVAYGDIFVMDEMEYLMTGEENFTFEGEQALTGAVLFVTNEDVPKLYSITNHGETELPEYIANGIKRQGMELVALNLLTSDGIPADADGILISGPQRDISESEKEQLSAYLKAGGSLLYLTGDPTVGNEQPNLDSLLTEYGIIPHTGMVGEADADHYSTGSPALLLPDVYSHAITNPLREENYQVIMPYSKSLAVDPERPETVKVTELLVTTKEAFAKQGDNKEAYKEDGDLEGPFAVAAAGEDQATGARVVCIASAAQYFLDENFNAMVGGGNQDFFLNALSWMCEYEDGITIHSKSLKYDTLTMDNTTAGLWIVVLLLVPVGYIVFGALRIVQRKRK
jgi:ABC-2 type transport system permease protein